MKFLSFLLLIVLVGTAVAHELCIDTSGPEDDVNTFCSAYNLHTCCSPSEDAAIASLHASLSVTNTACNTALATLLCAQCEPWGAHLFGIELQIDRPGDIPIPYMCPYYANQFYAQCAGVTINWTAGQSPFVQNKISDRYPTSTAFCNDFCSPLSLGEFCYNGSVYVPSTSAMTYSGAVCMSRWATSSYTIFMQDLGNGQMLLAQKNGMLIRRRISDGASLGAFMTITNVHDNGEAGLLSIAIHPNFAANGRWFAFYSQSNAIHPIYCGAGNQTAVCGKNINCNGGGICQANHASVVAEFQSNGTHGDLSSKRELLVVAKPYGNHNGGQILFDSQGYLMIFLGDGGDGNDPQNRSQDLNNIQGKLLRIDVDSAPAANKQYAIPASNPALSTVWPEIYAIGLRNPWRSSFDSLNPTVLYVGDVGQNAREEVDIVTNGGNYGWRKYEGKILNGLYNSDPLIPSAVAPILDYPRSTGACIIGGYVYRGQADLSLYGRYIFGDLSNGLFVATETGGNWDYVRVNWACNDTGCPTTLGELWSFYEDKNQDLYAIATNGILRLSARSKCFPNPTTSSTASSATVTSSATTSTPTVTSAAASSTSSPTIAGPSTSGPPTNGPTTNGLPNTSGATTSVITSGGATSNGPTTLSAATNGPSTSGSVTTAANELTTCGAASDSATTLSVLPTTGSANTSDTANGASQYPYLLTLVACLVLWIAPL